MTVLGVDVGGTFTDAVLLSGDGLRTAKVPTARRQEESVLAAARAVGADGLDRFTHGTTVATNALLERKGARTAFVATEGFEHLLHLRRQNRAHLYRLCEAHPEPLVPLERCHGVRERIGPEGVIAPLELDSLPVLGDDVEAVAVCLLFAFRDASHERAVADGGAAEAASSPCGRLARARAGVPRVRAGLDDGRRRLPRPDAVSGYLRGTRRLRVRRPGCPEPLVMRSSGGVATLGGGGGPSGSRARVRAGGGRRRGGADRAARRGRRCDLARHGRHVHGCVPDRRRRGRAGARSARWRGCHSDCPTVDLQTVGAGGGSIVWRDSGGALRVGPESAGAEPGPACYGHGGERPTVTDANLLLGRLPDRIAGELELDRAAAERAFAGVDPAEAIEVVNAEMLRALRLVSVERGLDPRGVHAGRLRRRRAAARLRAR